MIDRYITHKGNEICPKLYTKNILPYNKVRYLNWKINSSTVSVLNNVVRQSVLAFIFLHYIVSRKVVTKIMVLQ